MLGVGINLWRTSITHGGAIPDPPRIAAFRVTAPIKADAGVSFSFTVQAIDQHGAAFPSYAGTVHFTSTDPAAILPANAALSAGAGTFPATLQEGNFTISATDTLTPTLKGTSGAITVAPVSTSIPASLFANGETGGWWDPSDMSTMFQDAAGTIPAVIGQRVALIKDKSGNGNDLSNNSVSQPTLKQDGIYNFIDFDVNNPVLFNSAMPTFVIPITRFTAINQYGWATGCYLIEGQNYGIGLYQNAPYPDISLSASPGVFVGPVSPALETSHVIAEVFNGAASSLQMDTDAPVTGDAGIGPDPGGIWYGGGGSGNTNFRFFGGLAIGRVLTAVETSDTEAFFATKLPPSLPPVVEEFPPTIDGVPATTAADFVANQGTYWVNGAQIYSFALWVAGLGGDYSRASAATYMQGGVLKTAAAGVQRLPTDLAGVAQGIRLTGVATNKALHSNDFTVAPWGYVTSVVSVSGVGPDRVSPAYKIMDTTADARHYIYQRITGYAAGKLTQSVFMKAQEHRYGYLSPTNAGTVDAATVVFDLTTGEVTSTSLSNNPTNLAYGSIPLADGWFFLWVSFDTTAGDGYLQFGPCNTAVPVIVSNQPAWAGDGVSGVLAFGAQAVSTGYGCPFDYIPTTTVEETQAQDSLSYPIGTTTFSALLETNGLFLDNVGGTPRMLAVVDDCVMCVRDDNTFAAAIGGGSFIQSTVTSISAEKHKVMTAGGPAGTWLTADGQVPNTLPQGVIGVAGQLAIGSYSGGNGPRTVGNFTRFAVWDDLVAPPAEMQRLTT